MKRVTAPFMNDGLVDELDFETIYLDAEDPSDDDEGSVRELLIHVHSTETQYNAQATNLCDGSHVVTWQSFGVDGEGWSIHGQHYDPRGSQLGTPFRVSPDSTPDQYNPSVTALCDGGFVVTWQSFSGFGDEWHSGIYGQRFDQTCVPVGGCFTVALNAEQSHTRPTVETLCDGGFVVTWNVPGEASGHCCTVKGRRFDPDGLPQGETVDAWHDRQGAVWLHDNPALMSMVENNRHLTGYSLRHLMVTSTTSRESHRVQPCPMSERHGQHQRPCHLHREAIKR